MDGERVILVSFRAQVRVPPEFETVMDGKFELQMTRITGQGISVD